MSKTSVFTTITPLPSGITRQSVLDMYRNHIEMIELNPLVVERFKCKPPSYAPAEEFYSTWYTIKDKVSYLPGGLANGSVSYHACFHDLPDALQTRVYAPLGLDIRAKWSVGGSLPGEPKEAVELGLGIPKEGLYIREDVKMRCNIMMISFVKKTFKESHSKLVDRLVEKAHLLEAKQANERLNDLKNMPPGERMGHGQIFIAPPPGYNTHEGHASMGSIGSCASPMNSPGLSQSSTLTGSPYMGSPPYQHSNPRSSYGPRISYMSDQKSEGHLSYLPDTKYDPSQQYQGGGRSPQPTYNAYAPPPVELPSDGPPVPPKDNKKNFTAELPG